MVQFGGRTNWPLNQTVPYTSLNDGVYFYVTDIEIDGTHIQNQFSQRTWFAHGVWMSQDFAGRKITLTVIYDEGGNGSTYKSVSQVLGNLIAMGEQNLTFDNITAIPARLNSMTRKYVSFDGTNYLWELKLEFLSRMPWMSDISPTNAGTLTMPGGTPPPPFNFQISYAGTVFSSPVIVIAGLPASNSILNNNPSTLTNTASGESLTFTIPALGSTGQTFTIDCENFGTYGSNGAIATNVSGSFPQLYPGTSTPQVNGFTLVYPQFAETIGATTVTTTYYNKWEL